MALFSEDISINNVISSGSSIRGDIKINGFMRIDGDLDGNLESTGDVIVGEKARIRGNVSARSITIGGIVCGNITAPESVRLLSSSAVIGDILTHSLQADEHVVFHGHCISLRDADSYAAAARTWENTQAIVSKVVKVQ
ncbi:MAG: polymer-forming cytoskeletal protein [Treponema sp.]|jgi:cytoskeletal protein CcmA (bactofilin family)|nr:polymer-forming cytoskeletal protein [Treponema sp.]